MTSAIRRKLAFFKDCLAAESRAQIVWNYPTRKSQHVVQIEVVETSLTVRGREWQKFDHTLERYTRERCLLLHRGFINGPYAIPSFAGSRRRREVSCPIFIYPCDLNEKNRVNVDVHRGIVNPAAVDILQHIGIKADDLMAESKSRLTEEMGEVKDDEFTLSLHALFLTRVKQRIHALSNGELMFDTIAQMSIEPKVASAQGSLYELEALCERRAFSMPLKQVLGAYKSPMALSARGNGFWSKLFTRPLFILKRPLPLPETLSEAQAKVIECAKRYPLSVVSGPPGTGKSFTIACLALSEFSQGKSVLVVSQNQHAADVVRRKLIDDMGIDAGLTVLASEKGASSEAKSQLNLMLRRKYKVTPKQIKTHRKRLFEMIDQLSDLERKYQKRIQEINYSKEETQHRRGSLWQRFWGHNSGLDTPFHELFLKLEDLEKSVKKQIVVLIQLEYEQTAKLLAKNPASRQSISAFAASLTAKDEHYQERYYKSVNIDHALKAVPLWFAAVGNLNRIVPNEREMFDLVIIDEATQCNLSVCLPALQRAKRAVIVGDVKQLKHVSFVSYDLQQSLAEQYGLDATEFNTDFRNTSVLEYAIDSCRSGSQSVQLDEHFRSHPQIIEFSNREFYEGGLRIMTERPTNREQSIRVVKVDGKRLNKGINKKEAAELLAFLQQTILDQGSLSETDVHEIGILAFFSAQATYLEKLIFDEISLNNIRRHNIRIGTPFSFQGEERDHMLISCSVDASTAAGSYNYLNRDDVFNVAITRARDYQTLFISCGPEQVRANSKLASYLKFIEEYKAEHELDRTLKKDAFQAEICEWLKKRGAQSFPNFLVGEV